MTVFSIVRSVRKRLIPCATSEKGTPPARLRSGEHPEIGAGLKFLKDGVRFLLGGHDDMAAFHGFAEPRGVGIAFIDFPDLFVRDRFSQLAFHELGGEDAVPRRSEFAGDLRLALQTPFGRRPRQQPLLNIGAHQFPAESIGRRELLAWLQRAGSERRRRDFRQMHVTPFDPRLFGIVKIDWR